MPKVSVILPTYNRSNTLGRAIHSVLNQTYKDLELIVVDDGSTDNTEMLVKNIASKDHRVRYIKLQNNMGHCKARNTGILASSGIFIAFQDSDDEWLPEKLRKQVETIKTLRIEIGLVYCFVYYIKDGKKNIFYTKQFMPDEADLYKKGLMYMFRCITMQACLFRREVFDTCGYFDENIKAWGEDLDMLMKVSKEFKFFCINEPLVNIYSTEGSLSKDRKKVFEDAFYIFRKYYDDIKKDCNLLSIHYFWLSKLLRKTGKKTQSRKFKIKAWFFNKMNKLRHFTKWPPAYH